MKRLFAAWRDVQAPAVAVVDVRDESKPRVAAVPDVPKKRPAFFAKPSRAPPAADLAAPPNVVYSSSSSDGSVVQTPEPDDDLRHAPSPKPRWPSWKPKPKTPHVAAVWDPARPAAAQPEPTESDDDDDDDESDHYDEPEPVAPPRPAPAPAPTRTSQVLQPATILRAQMNLRAITLAALLPPPSPPPLLHLPSAPLFPRSTNSARKLPRVQNTYTVLHKTVLLRRLEARALSRADNESIAQFGNRPRRAVPKARPSRQGIDEEAVSDVNKKVRYYSRGLQTWLDRPCFEDRCVLWTWDTQGRQIIARGVIGSGRAVASLEFSEDIEALAGYGVEPPSLAAPAAQAPPKTAPILQPLRITSPPVHYEAASPGTSTPNPSTGPPTPVSAVPLSATPRKILRFVEEPDPDDEEDNVPLGFQVRGKRRIEEQAEERARLAEEQAREEERMRRVLAQEVKAARARREGARSGMMHEVELERVKDRRASYTRTAYDPAPNPRRMASEPDPRVFARPASHSRPASVVETKSRPASIRSVRTDASRSVPPPSMPTLPPPPHLPRSSTMQNLEDEKRRRRSSAISESASASGSMRHHASTPPMPLMGMPMMPTVPHLPMMYPVVPGTPQFFYMQAQAQAQMQMPLLPPVRPGLPVSRSLEGLHAPRSPHTPRQESPRRDERRRSSLVPRGSRQ